MTSGLTAGWNTLPFAVAQRAGSSYGLDYSGSVDYSVDPTSGTSAIPEPGSMLLLATGLLGLGGIRSWRKEQRGQRCGMTVSDAPVFVLTKSRLRTTPHQVVDHGD